MSWNIPDLKETKPICGIKNKKLRISYNDVRPFFSVENNQIVNDTFEGDSIKSFINKNNLTLEFIDEDMTWGNRDSNGRFNGVVGRVM